jgi:uncharacterized surface protein with fasciclin (FAS1) repeats
MYTMSSSEPSLLPIAGKNIVEVIKENPSGNNLTTLVGLFEEFKLNITLSEPVEYTVFAPTNIAFQIDTDISPNQYLSVLNYHVVEGKYLESDLVNGSTLITLQGETLIFTSSTDDKPTMVNDKNIITPNIPANNGIIHVIDGVLIPDK